MAKNKQEADEMTAPSGLPPRFMFAVGERMSAHCMAGEVVTQDGPWTLTVQQERGGRITVGTELLSKA